MMDILSENVLEKNIQKKFIKYSGVKCEGKYLAQMVSSPNTTFWQKMKEFYFSKFLSVKLLGKKISIFYLGNVNENLGDFLNLNIS